MINNKIQIFKTISKEFSSFAETVKFGKIELLVPVRSYDVSDGIVKKFKNLVANHDSIVFINGEEAHIRVFTTKTGNTLKSWFKDNPEQFDFISKVVTEHVNINRYLNQPQHLVTDPTWKIDKNIIKVFEPDDKLIEYFWNHREEIFRVCQSNPIRASRVIEIIAYLQNSGLN